MDDQAPIQNANRLNLPGTLIALLAATALIGGALYWYSSLYSLDQVTKEDKQKISEVAAMTREGNYDEAIANYNSIVEDAAYDKNTKARATVAVSHARLRGADDTAEAIQQIRDLKSVVADTDIEPKTRAEALYVLGAAYDIDGLNDDLYREVYSTEPYASMKIRVSRSRTALQVYEWSYSIYPLSRTALSIALMHVRDVMRIRYADSQLNKPVDPQKALNLTEEYLLNAELLQATESKEPRYQPGISDLAYRYWRTFLIGDLALLKGGDYTKQYRGEYEMLIQSFEQNGENNQEMTQYLNFAYWNYATMLVLIDKDNATAKVQLEKLVKHVQADRFYNVNQFVSVMKSYKNEPRVDLNSKSLKFLGDISPAFKKFVEDIQNGN